MSRADATMPQGARPAPSAEYRNWLQRERRTRLTIRGAQLALLLIFLVGWEVLPRAQIINPLCTT